jgi:hypothetical protein
MVGMKTRVRIYDDGSASLVVGSHAIMTTWDVIGTLATQCEQQLQDFDTRKRKEQHAKNQG